MLDSISTETKDRNIFNETSEPKVAGDSIEVQLGVLKEVAFSLLRQLDVIRRGKTQHIVEGRSLHDELREFEIELINLALAKTHGHQRRAAGLLGLKVTTLNAKMKRYHIMSRFYMPLGEVQGRELRHGN